MRLKEYNRKRNFEDTPEPSGSAVKKGKPDKVAAPIFVIQLHHASVRHYDFRLEVNGTLKSWAVPKGPSLRPGEKRLAVEVEDHPISYAGFEGDIPEGNYGAGHVDIFDKGTWSCKGDPQQAIKKGSLDFILHGEKLGGAWKLVRTSLNNKKPQWLLLKRNDDFSRDAEADDLVTTPSYKLTSKKTSTKISKEKHDKRKEEKSVSAWAQQALAIRGSRKKSFPAGFKPQLAILRKTAPQGENWLHEIKWDGYRMLADLDNGKVTLRSRNDLNWTKKFPLIARAIEALPVKHARLDGELVALDKKGGSDFTALQKTLEGTGNSVLHYMIFDLPGIEKIDISSCTLQERKSLLEKLLKEKPTEKIHSGKKNFLSPLIFSQHIVGHGEKVFAATMGKGIEGIISKRADSPYLQYRSPDWIKVKHQNTDEFIIVGYTQPKGSRSAFGALLMATRDAKANNTLRYVGRVGTGYNNELLLSLYKRLVAIEQKKQTVEIPSHTPLSLREVHWVKPELVAEIEFRGWAKEGLLRQASFKRLREDKPIKEVTAASSTKNISAENIEITHPERIVFPEAKITKSDIAAYYQTVAQWMLPELINRPLSLVRCPAGTASHCFFQKHLSGTTHFVSRTQLDGKTHHGQKKVSQKNGKKNKDSEEHIHSIRLEQKSGEADYFYIKDVAGLIQLVQINTLEFHPWGSRVDDPEHPDRLTFDLDPGEGVTWKEVVTAARAIRTHLQKTGLESFLRLSGGKGLHIVVPIKRGPDWEEAKAFCSAFAHTMVALDPQKYIATMSKAKRRGKIFIDWLRNDRGATSVTSWSLRARPNAPVAMPIRWDDLGKIKSSQEFYLKDAKNYAEKLKEDPWQGMETLRQKLPKFSGKSFSEKKRR